MKWPVAYLTVPFLGTTSLVPWSRIGDHLTPIWFLDFETVNPAVPLFEGTRPYQVIPFQWSAHRMDGDDTMRHLEYLHDGTDDPRPGFLRSLLAALGKQGAVCVYSAYESTQLNALKAALPQHAREIDGVRARIVDLLPLVREHVYHPAFHGTFSIKSVYPALVPDAGYGDLSITDGSSASAAYLSLAAGAVSAQGAAPRPTGLLPPGHRGDGGRVSGAARRMRGVASVQLMIFNFPDGHEIHPVNRFAREVNPEVAGQ